MQTLTHLLLKNSLEDKFINNNQLKRIIKGSRQRRYHLVNRAIKAGELMRLKQGLYLVKNKYNPTQHHPFVYAQSISPCSYVSLESALSYHGWIPEAVVTVTSIVSTRKSSEYSLENNVHLSFNPLAIHHGYFLEMVHRVKLAQHTVLIASPIRALMDLVCFNKAKWQDLSWFEDSLRIDRDKILSIASHDLDRLERVYKQKRMIAFIEQLKIAINLESKQ